MVAHSCYHISHLNQPLWTYKSVKTNLNAYPTFSENELLPVEILELTVADDELASKVMVTKRPTSECGWTVVRSMRPVICIWTGGNNTSPIIIRIHSYFGIRTGSKYLPTDTIQAQEIRLHYRAFSEDFGSILYLQSS